MSRSDRTSPNQNKVLSPTELKRLHREWRRSTSSRLALILDGVQKPYNVGSIVRSAAAYRVEHLWLVPPTPALTDPKVTKVALGCERLVQSSTETSGTEAVQKAKEAGFVTVAIELTNQAKPLFDVDLAQPVCLILGHEERGAKGSTLQAVDHTAFIPQLGKVGSLNVAHAASVALYETLRQAHQ